eukprot:1157013-Pelagomonas_calceolata.AAC.4
MPVSAEGNEVVTGSTSLVGTGTRPPGSGPAWTAIGRAKRPGVGIYRQKTCKAIGKLHLPGGHLPAKDMQGYWEPASTGWASTGKRHARLLGACIYRVGIYRQKTCKAIGNLHFRANSSRQCGAGARPRLAGCLQLGVYSCLKKRRPLSGRPASWLSRGAQLREVDLVCIGRPLFPVHNCLTKDLHLRAGSRGAVIERAVKYVKQTADPRAAPPKATG